ncbi:isocitrate lyase [Candidatus Woesearchaeota archaeon]|nr:isocitrate lyase [Candidatus Woesearchaeota archaeon]
MISENGNSKIVRPYTKKDVSQLQNSIKIEHTMANQGSKKLHSQLKSEGYVSALGALTGNQAIQQVEAGLRAIYVSGWQVAADGNTSGTMYPDLGLYPSNSMPATIRAINNALLRKDQIEPQKADWLVPVVADGEAGFGGVLNTYELTKNMIEAGVAGIHLEDQLPSARKCGHLGGKVLITPQEFIDKLVAARLASDVLDVPTVIIARTDAYGAEFITYDVDPDDKKFLSGEQTYEGFYKVKGGIDLAIKRALKYAPYADALWFETPTPNLHDAKLFSENIHKKYPNKALFYNCSPSFNWTNTINVENFQDELGKMGYKFQFVTLAGFHSLNSSMFNLSKEYKERGMAAYSELQHNEINLEDKGYSALKHQSFVGTKYYDNLLRIIMQNKSSTNSLDKSTEINQF